MVLVSNPFKFIFLKTSKTAGTTAEMVLEPACAPEGHVVKETVKTIISEVGIVGSRLSPLVAPPQPALEAGMWYHHKPAAEVLRDLGAERFNAYTKITTVRNPFDRCVSVFHWRNAGLAKRARSFADLRGDFRNFIKSLDWKTDEPNVFVDGKFIINRAIRFEHLSEDLADIFKTLGLPPRCAALPHTKSTADTRKSYPVADYYDQTCIDIVRTRLSWVFDIFDYPNHPRFIQETRS